MEKISKLTSLFGLSSIETRAGMPFRRRTSDLTWRESREKIKPEQQRKAQGKQTHVKSYNSKHNLSPGLVPLTDFRIGILFIGSAAVPF